MMIMTRITRAGKRERRKRAATHLVLVPVFAALLFLAGCGANEGILKSGRETPAPANADSEKPPFAKDLDYMRSAGFTFVYVLRRKDGGVMDAEDRNVIRLNTADANRRVAADDGRAFIIGSNFQIPANNLIKLYDRFAVENYSQPPAVNVNRNANANK